MTFDSDYEPWFEPPGWIIGPIWLVLYTMLAISFTMMLLIEKTELICKQKSCESLPIIVLTKATEEEDSSLEMSKSLEDISNEEDSASFHRDYISFGDLQLVSDNPKQ